MGDKQVTTMVLKVDLQCYRCYKKIKKVLCKFPQVQDQVYDEKQNTVTIKVVCCSPEKIKQKIICKAGDTLKSIEIKVPEKPKPKPKEPEKPKEPAKPKEPEKAKGPKMPKEPELPEEPEMPKKPKEPPKPKEPEMPKEPEKPKPAPPPPAPQKPEEPEKPKKPEQPKPAPPPPKPVPPVLVPCVPGYPPPPPRTCCTECYEGRSGGPCFYGCGPPGPPPCYQYDGYYGRPVYDSYGGSRAYYTGRCDYFSEENTGACSIM